MSAPVVRRARPSRTSTQPSTSRSRRRSPPRSRGSHPGRANAFFGPLAVGVVLDHDVGRGAELLLRPLIPEAHLDFGTPHPARLEPLQHLLAWRRDHPDLVAYAPQPRFEELDR